MSKKYQPTGVGMTPCKSEFGMRIRARRLELNLRQIDLAVKLGVSKQFVSQLELGMVKLSNKDDMISQVAEILTLDVNELKTIRPKRKLKQIETKSQLGSFLFERRLELGLNQTEVANKAGTIGSLVSGAERGTYNLAGEMLVKISRALECEIPAELVQTKKKLGRPKAKKA